MPGEGNEAVSKRGDMLPLVVSSAFVALVPKCPLCLFALLGATGAAGTAAAAWIPGVMVALLLGSVGAVWMRCRGEGKYGPAVIAAALAVVILAGRFLFASAAVVYSGAAALFVVAIANYLIERIPWRKPQKR